MSSTSQSPVRAGGAAAPRPSPTDARPPVAAFSIDMAIGQTWQATDGAVRHALDPADRLWFEQRLQWLRLTFLASPVLVLTTFGTAALPFAIMIVAATLASYVWMWVLLNRFPGTLLRNQLLLRVLDCGLVYLVLVNYHGFLHNAYYDSVYLLFVVAAAATHEQRGALVGGGLGGAAVLAGRLQLMAEGALSPEIRHLTDSIFYWIFFTATGLAVAFLMHKSGEVVERRDHTWRQALAERNEMLERTAAQLQATNHELEAFAYSVSHDLRAPLRSIDGFSRVVLDRYGEALDAQGQDYLRRIRAASQRMGQLIDGLLTLSRLTRSELRFTEVDLSALATEIMDELRQRQPERRAEVQIAPGLRAQGDARLLRVLLANLLENAWKFTGRREVARIKFGATEQDGRPVYFVRDNGAGFDMAYADKLFGAFQRLHSAAEFDGTGIGLATVQRIVHRHGGQIWAEAAPDQGATFFFTLRPGGSAGPLEQQ